MTDRIGRRQVLAGGAAVAGGALFAPSLARAASGIKIGYVTPKDVLAGRQQEIHAERDRKLEAARQQRQSHRQQAP